MFARHADLLRKEVVVTSSGMEYRGLLVEVTDEDVKLRGKTGWIILPFSTVRSIEDANKPDKGFDSMRSVSAAFYDESAATAPTYDPMAEPMPEFVPGPPKALVDEVMSHSTGDVGMVELDDADIVEAPIVTGVRTPAPGPDPFFEATPVPPQPVAARPAAPAAAPVAAAPIAAPRPAPAPAAPRPAPVAAPRPAAPAAPAPAPRPAPVPAAAPRAVPPAAPAPVRAPAPAPVPSRPAPPPVAAPRPAAAPAPVAPPRPAPAPAAPARPAPVAARPATPPAPPPAPAPARPSAASGVVPAAEPEYSTSVEDLFREFKLDPKKPKPG